MTVASRLAGRAAVFALVATALACGPKKVKIPDTIGPTVVAPSNLFLRNGFDTDPSLYAGRFVPAGVTVPDETSAMPLTCSQHLKVTKVSGGGVQYDEFFNASTDASLHVGVPVVAGGDVGYGRNAVVRVKYQLTEKMVVSPDDPAAFEACCKAAGDQCTDRYIGEFLAGTGAVYYEVSEGGGVKGNGVTPQGIQIGAEVKNGVTWQRSVEFPSPVYFAFKTTTNNWTGAQASGCGPWTQAPPKSTLGQYFVGISPPARTESDARDSALTSGKTQVVRYLAESIETGTVSVKTTTGATDALSSKLESGTTVQTAAEGVARMVKDESWCVEPEATPDGNVYVAKVLMFLPKEAIEPAAQAVVEAVAPEGKPTP